MTLATRQLAWTDHGNGCFSATPAVAMDGDDESAHFGLPPNTIAVSVQFIGTFDSATCSLQGSNDDTTFAALPTAVANTSAGIKSVATTDLAYRYYRLFNASGGGSCAMLPIIYIRTATAGR